MADYNGAWSGPQIDEALRKVINKDLSADGVKFSDGQTVQQKYADWNAAATQAAAAMPKSGGTFTGTVKAGSSYQSYTTYLLRNSRLASSDTTPTVNGEICWTYG